MRKIRAEDWTAMDSTGQNPTEEKSTRPHQTRSDGDSQTTDGGSQTDRQPDGDGQTEIAGQIARQARQPAREPAS